VKLLDQVVQAASTLDLRDPTGRYQAPGAGEIAPRLRASPIRFVADERVSACCASLIGTDRGMLAGENEFLRVPAPLFWLEWSDGIGRDDVSGARTGLLVEADTSGRAGRITTVWEQKVGEPVIAQMLAEFDLDAPALADRGGNCAYSLMAGTHPLAPHLLLHIQPGWRSYFARHDECATHHAVTAIAANILPGIEFLLVFSALLAERACLRPRATDLLRLNRQRSRHGRAALLDHVEVALDLTPEPAAMGPGAGTREAARLHAVRGHLVSRGGQTFWRRSHLRGDPLRPGPVRTVQVARTGNPLAAAVRR
jgi:hypothetical protein